MFKWCPNGCGKKVVLSYRDYSSHSKTCRFKCEKCAAVFTKIELDEYWRTDKNG